MTRKGATVTLNVPSPIPSGLVGQPVQMHIGNMHPLKPKMQNRLGWLDEPPEGVV